MKKKNRSKLLNQMEIPKAKIQSIEPEILKPLRGIIACSNVNDRRAVDAATALYQVAVASCLQLSQISPEILVQIKNVHKQEFPVLTSLHPNVQRETTEFLKKLNIGSGMARFQPEHPATKVARSNVLVIQSLRKLKSHPSIKKIRKEHPFIRKVDALPAFRAESASKWWRMMKKMYDLQRSDKTFPLGVCFKIDDNKVLELVNSTSGVRSSRSSKESQIRSKYLNKIRVHLLQLSKSL
jgi:hypothetical protein